MRNPTKTLKTDRWLFLPYSLFSLVVAVALTSGMAQAQAPKPAAEPEEMLMSIPEFTVHAAKGNPYSLVDAISAARTSALLADTPASLSIVSTQFLTDINAGSILDATRYFSGLSAGRGAGIGGIYDRHVIRGFESDGRTIDNFQTTYQVNVDPVFIDRIEVVKGPNAILAPTGNPGGSINVISKSPQFAAENSVSVQVGTFDAQKFSFDSTGPLPFFKGDKLAYRIIGSFQDTNSFLPGKIKSFNIETALTWKISPTSEFTIKYFGSDWTESGAVGAANTWGIGVDPTLAAGATLYTQPPAALGFTYDGKNGVADWSTRKDRVNMVAAQYTVALGQHINMRFAANWFNSNFVQDQGLPSVPNIAANRYNPYTGEVTPNQTWALNKVSGVYEPTTSVLWNPTAIKRTATYVTSPDQNTQIQNDFAGNFNAGPVTIAPLVGWSSTTQLRFPYVTKTATLPTINLFAPDDNPAKPDMSAYTLGAKNSIHNWQGQAYAFLRLGAFDNRLLVSGGFARIWLDNRSSDLKGGTFSSLKDNTDTYLAGLLYKVLPQLSIYTSYSTNATGVLYNGQPLWRTGSQTEWGVKSDFFRQRLSLTLAHFQIAQNNLTTANPAFNVDPINNPAFLLSGQTNHGYEFEIKGGLTKDLSIVGSYTTQHLRDAFGRQPRNIPDKTAGLFLHYAVPGTFAKGLGVFGGFTYQGISAGETPAASATALGVIEQVGFYIPAFTVYNIGASYTWNKVSFNLTVDNVFDKKGFWQAAGRGSVPPIPGTNVRLTTTYRF